MVMTSQGITAAEQTVPTRDELFELALHEFIDSGVPVPRSLMAKRTPEELTRISSNTYEQYRDFPLDEGQKTRLSSYVLRLAEPHIADYITYESGGDPTRRDMPMSNDMYFNTGNGGRSTHQAPGNENVRGM